ncbi:MAG: tetratricopeptide repeat protein [Burkholderiaceae bacterium]|nr:tetratricopeptide repeat protein [Burkholderiaceae bacterium]
MSASLPAEFATAQQLHRTGRLQEAAAAYADLLDRDPRAAPVWHMSGVLECQCGRLREGASRFRNAVEIQPDFALAWMDLGAALRELADPAGALACFDRVVAIDPGHFDALNNRGEALSALRRHEEALTSYQAALRIEPWQAKAMNNAGCALLEMGKYQAALDLFDQAVSVEPRHFGAIANRGSALHGLGRHDESLAELKKAIAIEPRYFKAFSNRGSALHALGRYEESIVQFSKALEIRPDYAEARSHRGMTLLLLGRFRHGWIDFEARLASLVDQRRQSLTQPGWRGEEKIEGRTILLYAEQGLGDTLQFCRYASLVAARGARVVLEAQRELVPLLGTLGCGISVVAKGEPLPSFELQCPLLSLPLAFGTELSSIPAGAYLSAEPSRIERWQSSLGEKRRPRIGLTWSGNPDHRNDRNRSIALQLLLDAIGGIDCDFVSLQKDVRQSDAAVLAGAYDRLRHFGGELNDFGDTAALASLLDAVVTVDTSVAHLAGALGRPTWILLPWVPDWRWLLRREDSPWYPTAKLLRQRSAADWSAPLATLRRQLTDLKL